MPSPRRQYRYVPARPGGFRPPAPSSDSPAASKSEVAQGRPFDCLITGDAELRRLNREFLGKDYPTDVLSFPGPDPAEAAATHRRPAAARPLGDIAISFPRARAQARAFGHDTGQEIQILMLHGLLHLLGMDHDDRRRPHGAR